MIILADTINDRSSMLTTTREFPKIETVASVACLHLVTMQEASTFYQDSK